MAEDADHLVVITDANGVLLSVEGSPSLRLRAADHMNFTEGTLWSEPGAGTNAIGTAIAADHAVQVFGPEHFNEVVQRWTCSAAPIHDPDTGELLGVIDLTGDFSTVQPHSLAVATATAQAVEAWLRLEMQEHDLRLRARYGSRVAVAPGSRALVTPNGRPITDVPRQLGDHGPAGDPARRRAPDAPLRRHARSPSRSGRRRSCSSSAPRSAARGRPPGRSCACSCSAASGRCSRSTAAAPSCARGWARSSPLLCAHPEGRSADALCADLHGDEGRAASVRVEVSRLRKLLGPWIDTERYRLTCDVETDVRRVEGLLRAGAVREAAEEYPGPLLPGSEAPAIVEAREQLDAWLRQAVMTANDPRGPVGVGQLGQRPRRPRRVEAPARRAGVPRSAPQPVRGADRRAAPLADLTRPSGADAAPL